MIQSTVADTCIITLWMMARERKARGLKFKFVNQIHDAIVLAVPEDEIDQTKQVLYDTMATIAIPLPKPLVLGIDIDVMSRWGVKQ